MSHHPPQLPPQMVAVDDIVPQTKALLEKYKTVRDNIVRTITTGTACFQNTIKPLIDVENETNGKLGVIAMLQYASPIPEARQASEEAVALMGTSQSTCRAREDIYLLVKAVHDRGEDLDAESRRYLETELREFRRFGHGLLTSEQIEQYSTIRNKIDKLRQEFNRNVREEDGGVWFAPGELEGVPEDDLAHFEKAICENGQDQLLVKFRRAEMTAVLKYATKASTRKKLFIAGAARFAENDQIFKEIVMLRDENARLLGYANHAAFRIENRAAKTTEWVQKLCDELEHALMPVGQKEMDELCAIKRECLHRIGSTEEDLPEGLLNPWDAAFYTRIASEAVAVDAKKIAEFFPLEHVKPAMLEIFASCLQLKFEPAPAELMTNSLWHEDVEAWCVWDDREKSKGEFIGYLFLDLLWRPGKYKGNQCVNLQSGYKKDDGSRMYPATILMCSFASQSSAPTPLLEHSQLVTMFHELGHGIHDLVSTTAFTTFHGWHAPPDFAEAPSVMLENWCWLPSELKKLSCHYTKLGTTTPEHIPDDMLETLVQSRNMQRALWLLRQLALARYDLIVHSPSDHQSCKNMDIGDVYAKTYDRLTLIDHPFPDQRGYPHADFTHLTSGYDAGYYSYLAAQVFAADLFATIFAESPRDPSRWEDYRQAILVPGGSRDGIEMITEFLGRAPAPSALLGALNR